MLSQAQGEKPTGGRGPEPTKLALGGASRHLVENIGHKSGGLILKEDLLRRLRESFFLRPNLIAEFVVERVKQKLHGNSQNDPEPESVR
jgi:hypothetical protein